MDGWSMVAMLWASQIPVGKCQLQYIYINILQLALTTDRHRERKGWESWENWESRESWEG